MRPDRVFVPLRLLGNTVMKNGKTDRQRPITGKTTSCSVESIHLNTDRFRDLNTDRFRETFIRK